jgi:hypothetical protein
LQYRGKRKKALFARELAPRPQLSALYSGRPGILPDFGGEMPAAPLNERVHGVQRNSSFAAPIAAGGSLATISGGLVGWAAKPNVNEPVHGVQRKSTFEAPIAAGGPLAFLRQTNLRSATVWQVGLQSPTSTNRSMACNANPP